MRRLTVKELIQGEVKQCSRTQAVPFKETERGKTQYTHAQNSINIFTSRQQGVNKQSLLDSMTKTNTNFIKEEARTTICLTNSVPILIHMLILDNEYVVYLHWKVFSTMSVLDLCLMCAVTGLNENPMQKNDEKLLTAGKNLSKLWTMMVRLQPDFGKQRIKYKP